MKKRFSLFLILIFFIALIFIRFIPQSKVEVRKPLEENTTIFDDPKTTPGYKASSSRTMPTGSKQITEEIPLSKLDVVVNKELAILDLDIYFRTANIKEDKNQYQNKIETYKAKQTAAVEQARNAPQKPIPPDKTVPTFSDTTIPKKNEGVSATKEGSRVLESQMYESISWDKMQEEQATKYANDDRILKTELPRKFQSFSLGDFYQTTSEYITLRNDVSWKEGILDFAEGRLFHKKMYYFVLNFKPTIDPYYLSVILQNIFGETDVRTFGTYLVFDWSDQKTRIEYTIYSPQKCRLHFYDIALGLEKTKSN